jgi:hypothetical protein
MEAEDDFQEIEDSEDALLENTQPSSSASTYSPEQSPLLDFSPEEASNQTSITANNKKPNVLVYDSQDEEEIQKSTKEEKNSKKSPRKSPRITSNEKRKQQRSIMLLEGLKQKKGNLQKTSKRMHL